MKNSFEQPTFGNTSEDEKGAEIPKAEEMPETEKEEKIELPEMEMSETEKEEKIELPEMEMSEAEKEEKVELPEKVVQCIAQEKSKLVEEINNHDSVIQEYNREGKHEAGRFYAGLTSFMFGIPILGAALLTGGSETLSIEAGIAAVLAPHAIEGVREIARYGMYKHAEHKRKEAVKTLLGGASAESVPA